MISIERLKEILDQHFSEPFLPKGTVETKWIMKTENDLKDRELYIKIGRRDIWLTSSGEVVGAETFIEEETTYSTQRCYDPPRGEKEGDKIEEKEG